MVDGTKGISLTALMVKEISKQRFFLRGMCFVVHGLRAWQDTSLPRSIGGVGVVVWPPRSVYVCTIVMTGGCQTSSWLELRGRRRVKENTIQKGGGGKEV